MHAHPIEEKTTSFQLCQHSDRDGLLSFLISVRKCLALTSGFGTFLDVYKLTVHKFHKATLETIRDCW